MMPGTPYAVLKYWLGNSLTWKDQLSKQNGDRKTSNELPPRGVIDISVNLENSSVHAILSSSGSVI